MHVNLLNAPGMSTDLSSRFFPVAPAHDLPDHRALLAEADHRIGNHLALLSGYVRLQGAALANQGEEPSRESMQTLLAGIGAQIAAVSRLHRTLASDEQWAGEADLGENLREICAGFAASFAGVEIIEEIFPGCTVRPDQILPLSQIVAEVITKALCRAQRGGRAGMVVVRCCKDDLGGVVVEVSDRAAEPDATFEPEPDGGIGDRLVTALSRQVGARIGFQATGQGVRFRLTLSRSTVWPRPDIF